jgi:hypothetical protein
MTQNVELNQLNVRNSSQIVEYLSETEKRIAEIQVFA